MKASLLLLSRVLLLLFVVQFVFTSPAILATDARKTLTHLHEQSPSYSTLSTIRQFISFTVNAVSVRSSERSDSIAHLNLRQIKGLRQINSTQEAENRKAAYYAFAQEATKLYELMDLEEQGLTKKAFIYGWIGYHKLQERGLLQKTNVLSICDFSQASSQERMYVIDVRHRKLLFRTFVAHGINSGDQFARSFSNSPESCKSSLGFYVTARTYMGINGLSLRIDGVDKGFNDMASRRNIVIHGAPYVSRRILEKYGELGTTFGCPAIPEEMTGQIIPTVKNGSCFFIYFPSKKYLAESPVLNG